MLLLFELIWFAFPSLIVSGYALQRRAPCLCAAFDAGNFPLSTKSGVVDGVLRCIYLDTSRCLYSPVSSSYVTVVIAYGVLDTSQTNGSLQLDSDFSSCPPMARGGRCPTSDLAQECLGPGSTVLNSTLYCTYPRPLELADTSFFCEYTVWYIAFTICIELKGLVIF
jgi:hypothetical protein